MSDNERNENEPEIHKDLTGFNIHIDEFGQVQTTLSQAQINSFLNENVQDKKFSPEVLKQLEKRSRQIQDEEE